MILSACFYRHCFSALCKDQLQKRLQECDFHVIRVYIR